MICAALGCTAPRAATSATLDSLRSRFELGAGSLYTNELFYTDTFTDTTFQGRQLEDAPERSLAALCAAVLEGSRGGGSVQYLLRQDVQWGDRLQRSASQFTWRSGEDVEGAWWFAPWFEYRRDRTFDRDLREWRGRATTRYRRALGLLGPVAEAALSADFLRASGAGSEYSLDRQGATAMLALEAASWPAWEARAGYSATTREFPDSSERDHYEHAGEARVRVVAGALSLTAEGRGSRRVTVHLAPTSRDNFWEWTSSIESDWLASGAWAARARGEFETTRYDLEDSTLFFDYSIARLKLGPRRDGDSWSLWFGARGEWLVADRSPGEAYREAAAFAELEAFRLGSLWSIAPSVGWRDYESSADDPFESLHSSLAFLDFELIADQRIPAGLRLQAVTQARLERHVDESQDAASLYFSIEVRKIF